MSGFLDRIQVIIDSKFSPDGFVQAGAAGLATDKQQQTLIQRLTQGKAAWATWGLAGAGATALVATGAFAAAKEFADLGEEVRTVQRATGDSAETASRWVAVGDDFGITASQIQRSFSFMGRAVANGTVDLSRWGAEVTLNKQGNVDMKATIESVSEAYNRQTDDAQRAALIQAAFGRSGRDLLPILEQGRDGIREMFAAVPDDQILSQEEVDNARRFNLALDNVEDALKEIAITAGSEVAPAITSIADAFAGVVRGAKDVSEAAGADVFGTLWDIGPIAQFGAAADGVGKILDGDIAGGLERIVEKGNPFGAAATGLKDMFSSGFDADAMIRRLARSQEEGKQKAEQHAGAIERQASAFAALNREADDYINATVGVEQANLRVETSIDSYMKALFEHGEGSREARQAQLEVKDAIIAAGEAAKTATGSTQSQIQTLQFLAGTLAPGSPLRVWLNGYIQNIDAIPAAKGTLVTVDLEQARSDVKAFLDSIPPEVQVRIRGIGGGIGGADTNGDGIPD